MPALLNRMSISPSAAAILPKAAATRVSLLTSAVRNCVLRAEFRNLGRRRFRTREVAVDNADRRTLGRERQH